jgi:hypothetical protein
MVDRADSIEKLEQNLALAEARLAAASRNSASLQPGPARQEFATAWHEKLTAERALAAAKGEEYAVPIDFPIAWDVGAPLPFVIQNEYRTLLTFFLRDYDPHWDGSYATVREPADPTPHSIAVVEFKRCHGSRLGDPNDEVHHGHPLYGRGLDSYTAQEVINSRWLAETEAINKVHSNYNADRWRGLHHYVLWFHDSTFECIAQSFEVSTFDKSLPEILSDLCTKLVQ